MKIMRRTVISSNRSGARQQFIKVIYKEVYLVGVRDRICREVLSYGGEILISSIVRIFHHFGSYPKHKPYIDRLCGLVVSLIIFCAMCVFNETINIEKGADQHFFFDILYTKIFIYFDFMNTDTYTYKCVLM